MKLSITVHGASATARKKIEAAGGTLTLLKEPKVRKVKHRRAAPRRRPRPTTHEPRDRRPRRLPSEAAADEAESEE